MTVLIQKKRPKVPTSSCNYSQLIKENFYQDKGALVMVAAFGANEVSNISQ
jgi:hypothetical protein